MIAPIWPERVLPSEETETEFFNRKRIEIGLKSIAGHVTKIRPGLHTTCGCEIGEVTAGHSFTVERRNDCDLHRNARHVVVCNDLGQAVTSIREGDWDGIGVMRLDQPFPYEVVG